MKQVTNSILMIRPVSFRMNEQTAVNNYYQKVIESLTPESIEFRAIQEFDSFVEVLHGIGVNVIVVNDTKETDTPDAIFPNNWISFHENGDVGLYPMFAENRRFERREDILETLEEEGFEIERKQVKLDEPIKSLGMYNVKVQIPPDVEASIKLWVISDESAEVAK